MLTQPPLLTIRRGFSRPDRAQVEKLRNSPTSFVVDCLGGRGALDYTTKPLSKKLTLCTYIGTALTCYAGPNDNLALYGALHIAEEGDVIVAATDAYTGAAITGDNVSGMMRNKGIAGLVTDGLVRDADAIINDVQFPIHCAGVSPNSPARTGPGTVGQAIQIGGVTVNAGDVIVADAEGVVVVPLSMLAAVIQRIDDLKIKEAATAKRIATGLTMMAEMEEFLASDRVLFI